MRFFPVLALIFTLIFTNGCANFVKNVSSGPTNFWNLDTKSHIYYSGNSIRVGSDRSERIRNHYKAVEQRSKELGWDKARPDPTDYWYNLNLHQTSRKPILQLQ